MYLPLLKRSDIAAVLIGIGVIGAVIFAYVLYPSPPRNWGFGPDWQCTYPGHGEPVCIKRPTNNSPDATTNSK